jgi:hypothetical protein
MAPGTGEVAIILTSEESKALEKRLRELTTNTGAPEVKALKAIEAKLKAAQAKML